MKKTINLIFTVFFFIVSTAITVFAVVDNRFYMIWEAFLYLGLTVIFFTNYLQFKKEDEDAV